jgi:uncharacterized coiled-coil protein SlyX
MRGKYLRRKQLRSLNKDESSITEEIGSNENNSISLQKDKSEGKESTPSKNKSEKTSSTISNRAKDEKLNTFSYMRKKDKKDNRLSIKQNIEEAQNKDNFSEQFQIFQKQFDELKKAHELKINNLEKKNHVQEVKINNLEKEKHAHELQIHNLQKDVRSLNVQVKELNKYFFAGKLRKLSKKLIEYIIKNFYYSYMKSMKSNSSKKRIYFVKAPRLSSLNWATDNDIIDALNRMLEKLFSKAKSNDLVIHFFDVKANKEYSLKKIYSVFKNKDEFFNYFKIIGNDKKIIDIIFPEDYLTIINNTSEDISIKNILNVISEVKIEEKNI